MGFKNKEAKNAYYQKNKERERLRSREYYLLNIEKLRAKGRKFYLKNKEKIRQRKAEARKLVKDQTKSYNKAYYVKNNERLREYQRKYRKENPEAARLAHRKWATKLSGEKKLARKMQQKISSLKYHYNISIEEYNSILISQNNLCALCRKEFGQPRSLWPVVDHDHTTGEIRGIIHNNCNALLGMAKDSTEILLLAVKYLQASKDSNTEIEDTDEPGQHQISYN